MRLASTEAARSRALQQLRDGRAAMARMEAVRERQHEARAAAERQLAQDEQHALRAGIPEVHGIACDLAGFHQRLRLLGVARASLLELGMRAAAAEARASQHAQQAQQAAWRGEQHRQAAERMALVARRLGGRARRLAEQSIEDELQEISTWSTP